MEIVKDLKDTLKGGYQGLHGEVVMEDCYRLRTLDFTPEIIFDLGANIGVFTRYARSLFPKAKIISVEPNEENCVHFRKFTEDKNTMLIEAAIGSGKMWHYLNSANGSHQVYVSEGLGYPVDQLKRLGTEGTVESCIMPTVLPAQLVSGYWKPGMRSIMKIDIEGGENAIFQDTASVAALKQMDYLAIEVHFYAIDGETHREVTARTEAVMEELEETHDCRLDHTIFYATKRKG